VHVPSRLREANSVQAEGLSLQEVDEEVAAILRRCLDTHGSQFDPSAISHKTAGLKRGDERLYERLNKLLAPGQLRSFVDKHPEFAWSPKNPGQKRPGMIITWATASGSANAGHAQDDQRTSGGVASGSANALCDQTDGVDGAQAQAAPQGNENPDEADDDLWHEGQPNPWEDIVQEESEGGRGERAA